MGNESLRNEYIQDELTTINYIDHFQAWWWYFDPPSIFLTTLVIYLYSSLAEGWRARANSVPGGTGGA
jgi:hypothetical protein